MAGMLFAAAVGAVIRAKERPTSFVTDVSKALVIGNGPSLEPDNAFLLSREYDCVVAVNTFAATPMHERVKPSHYLLQDRFWFEDRRLHSSMTAETIKALLEKTAWPMELCFPAQFKKSDTIRLLEANSYIGLKPMRQAMLPYVGPFIGSSDLRHKLSKLPLWLLETLWIKRLVTVDPTGVVSTTLFELILSNVRKIDLVGVDMTMALGLSSDATQGIVSIQSHFYDTKDSPQLSVGLREVGSIAAEYRYIASKFTTFDLLAGLARRLGIQITNRSTGSLLDSFPKELNDNVFNSPSP